MNVLFLESQCRNIKYTGERKDNLHNNLNLNLQSELSKYLNSADKCTVFPAQTQTHAHTDRQRLNICCLTFWQSLDRGVKVADLLLPLLSVGKLDSFASLLIMNNKHPHSLQSKTNYYYFLLIIKLQCSWICRFFADYQKPTTCSSNICMQGTEWFMNMHETWHNIGQVSGCHSVS